MEAVTCQARLGSRRVLEQITRCGNRYLRHHLTLLYSEAMHFQRFVSGILKKKKKKKKTPVHLDAEFADRRVVKYSSWPPRIT